MLTWSVDDKVRLWDLSLDETIPFRERRLELEVRTATTLDDSGHVQQLSFEPWEPKRQQLAKLRARRRPPVTPSPPSASPRRNAD